MSRKINDYGDILDPKDAKELLGVGWNKIYSLLSSGEILSFKIGRERKIPKECILLYIKNKMAEASAEIHNQLQGDDSGDSFTEN